jgi:membrane associated rhomboid family serine protease
MRTSFGFGTRLTRLGKRLLILYAGIYVIELVLEHWLRVPLVAYLQIYPPSSGDFHLWQILTHPFVHNPQAPLGFAINCLMLYFFAAPVEFALGSGRFLTLFYLSALGGALAGMAMSGVAGFNVVFMGMLPSLLALIVVFGLLNPEATILLMFILPVKAKYISYGTAGITFLTFLAKANPAGAYHLGGILCGYAYFRAPGTFLDPQLIYLKYLQWRLKRRKARFTVIDGKKGKDDDPPTYH